MKNMGLCLFMTGEGASLKVKPDFKFFMLKDTIVAWKGERNLRFWMTSFMNGPPTIGKV